MNTFKINFNFLFLHLLCIFLFLLTLLFCILKASGELIGAVILILNIMMIQLSFKRIGVEGVFILTVYQLTAIMLSIMIIVHGADVRVGRFSFFETHTHHRIFLMLSITGSFGFIWGVMIFGTPGSAQKHRKLNDLVVLLSLNQVRFFLVLALFFALFYVNQKGGVVRDGYGYGSPARTASFGWLRVAQVFLVVMLALPVLYALRKNNKLVYFYCFFILLIPTSAGARLDFLSPVLLLTFLLVFDKTRSIFQIRAIFGLIVAIAVYIVSNFLGNWRTGNGGTFDSSLIFGSNPSFVSLGTLNQIYSGTFTVIQWNLEGLRTLNGDSYLEYFYRLIPGLFRSDDHLLDLPSKLSYRGEVMQQGGLHVIGEAVWNFSYFGPFFVMFLFGVSLKFLENCIYLRSRAVGACAYVCMFGLAALSFRIMLYNGFVGFRVLSVGIFCFLLLIYAPLFAKKIKNNKFS